MGGVISRLPVELFEEVGTDNRQFAFVQCAAHVVR